MITLKNLTMRFGPKVLFQNVDLQLNPGCHYGLIGANGCGKSTLLKALWKDCTPDKGEILFPSQCRVGTLKQDHYLYENNQIIDVVLMGDQALWDAMAQKQTLLDDHTPFDDKKCADLERIEKLIEFKDGYTAEARAAKLLEGLGIESSRHYLPLKTLSGGYKLRVLLAQVLFSQPDLLLLDEPTNHLDLFSIKWLESYLKDFRGTFVITSHDKDFLNGTCSHILDLDHETITLYKGNYDQYENAKIASLLQKESTLEKQNKKKEDLQSFVDRFRAKSSKARQAQSKLKLVEKLEEEMSALNMQPSSRLYPHLDFQQVRPSGIAVAKVTGIDKSYGEKTVLKGTSFEIARGEKVAILGTNGIGKSTLLEILTDHTRADAGSHTWGHAVKWGYFPQNHQREVNGSWTLLDWLGQFDPLCSTEKLREILARVLFKGDDVQKTVNVLSGGETARLILAKLMLVSHNLLIFDEPTNHLDIESTEALLEALQNYEGTVLFVSHNRYFVSHLATRILEITAQGVKDYSCSYEEYVAKREIDLLTQLEKKTKASTVSSTKTSFEEQKNTRNLKNQLEKRIVQLEEKCQRIEDSIAKLNHTMAQDGFYENTSQNEINALMQKKEAFENQLHQIMEEWEKAGLELEQLLK